MDVQTSSERQAGSGGQNLPVSLLWPGEQRTAATGLDQAAYRDLDLEHTVEAFGAQGAQRRQVGAILSSLIDDPAVIRYRQAVLSDLLNHPDFAGRLERLLPELRALNDGRPLATPANNLFGVSLRLAELEVYVSCVRALDEAYTAAGDSLRSEGLLELRARVEGLAQEPDFRRLAQELPGLLEQVRSIASITIGVNLDPQLRPVEALLVGIHDRRFSVPSLLERLFGRAAEDMDGIAPLHASRGSLQADRPLMAPLFQDLADVTDRISRPVAQALRRYTQVNAAWLAELGEELSFYLGALAWIARLKAAGFPLCMPEIAPAEERVTEVEAAYPLDLALQALNRLGTEAPAGQVVQNAVALGEAGRVAVLTGPNQGGKTTYTKMTGLIHVLAQAGLPVPGNRARISPVDGIYTHFPIEEQPESDAGRLGEEARRLQSIFSRATRRSLILLNESLSSTSAGESLALARDLVRILSRMGARAIFSTHLHELAAEAGALSEDGETAGRVFSLVASRQGEDPASAGEDEAAVRRSFRVEPGPPLGYSLAREIARRYGISYDQLAALLTERGILR